MPCPSWASRNFSLKACKWQHFLYIISKRSSYTTYSNDNTVYLHFIAPFPIRRKKNGKSPLVFYNFFLFWYFFDLLDNNKFSTSFEMHVNFFSFYRSIYLFIQPRYVLLYTNNIILYFSYCFYCYWYYFIVVVTVIVIIGHFHLMAKNAYCSWKRRIFLMENNALPILCYARPSSRWQLSYCYVMSAGLYKLLFHDMYI